MQRPLGVTAIGSLCFLSGVYFCSFGVMRLIAPGGFAVLTVVPYAYGLRVASPYLTLAIGILWALIGWGLFRLRDWARFSASLLLAVGMAWALPMLVLSKVHFGWRTLAVCLEIVLRAVAACYLMAPSIIEAFASKRVAPSAVPHAPAVTDRFGGK